MYTTNCIPNTAFIPALPITLTPKQNKLLFDLCGVLRIARRLSDEEDQRFGSKQSLAQLAKELDSHNVSWSIQNKVAHLAITTDLYIQTCINKAMEV